MDTMELAQKIRRKCLEIAAQKTGCHLGGALSCADILAVLYGKILRSFPEVMLVFSKGHAAAAYYATLWESGRILEDPARVYGERGSFFTGHPNVQIPGVPFATGSLGHGPGLALGVSIARRMKGNHDPVYVLVGDGELQEGSCWEAFQVASSKKVSNYTVIIDQNGGQNDGLVDEISPLGNLSQKLSAFGFDVEEIDGHNHAAITTALQKMGSNKPRAILARTKKGFGVSALIGHPKSHYVSLTKTQSEKWMKELNHDVAA